MNGRTLIGVISGAAIALLVGLLVVMALQNQPAPPAGGAQVAQAAAPGAVSDAAPAAAIGGMTAPPAAGRAPVIVVVDRNALVRDSAVGQDLRRQIDELGKAAEAKFREEEKSLRDDMRELQEQASALSAEARQRKEMELRERAEGLQRKVQEEQAAIQNGIDKARMQIEQALGPILQQVFVERGATVMLERQAIVLGSVDIDITATVIQRLDGVLTAVKVEPAKPDAPAANPDAGAGQ